MNKEKANITQESKFPGGYVWYNQNHNDRIIENIKCIKFTHFYSHILYFLHKEDLIKLEDDVFEYLEIYLNDLDNPQQSDQEKYAIRLWLNGLYGRIYKHKNSSFYGGLLSKYVHLFYEDLLKHNSENILSIDTDIVFYKDEINLIDNLIPYETSTYSYGLIYGEKRWVYLDEGKIKVHGFHKKDKKMSILESRFKMLFRDYKLQMLGI